MRVPKIQVMAEVTREHRPPETFKLFLAERTDRHAGCELMGEMLNGSRTFLPVVDARGGIVFLRRDAIRMIALSGNEHAEETVAGFDGEGELMTAEVDVVFRDGQLVTGIIRFMARGEYRRIQDHLNDTERFLLIENKDTVYFVNKLHVLEVSPRRT